MSPHSQRPNLCKWTKERPRPCRTCSTFGLSEIHWLVPQELCQTNKTNGRDKRPSNLQLTETTSVGLWNSMSPCLAPANQKHKKRRRRSVCVSSNHICFTGLSSQLHTNDLLGDVVPLISKTVTAIEHALGVKCCFVWNEIEISKESWQESRCQIGAVPSAFESASMQKIHKILTLEPFR